MGQELISKAEFARRAGVSSAAITKACGKSLTAAVVGKRIDAGHPAALAYLDAQIPQVDVVVNGRTVKPRGWAARNDKKKQEPAPDILEVPADIQAFADKTLRELVERFGTDTRFLDWLKATKEIELINEKRIKNAQSKGELVSRELVKLAVIDPINAAHLKMLTDGAKTITRRVTAMHDANRDIGDIEKFVSDQIASFIKPVKAKVIRALKDE